MHAHTYTHTHRRSGCTERLLYAHSLFLLLSVSPLYTPCVTTMPPLLMTTMNYYYLLLEAQGHLVQRASLHITFPSCCADVCSRIDEMAEYINEHLRVQENTRRIMEIQKSLTGQNLPPLVAPGRRIIREGRLMKVRTQRSQQACGCDVRSLAIRAVLRYKMG